MEQVNSNVLIISQYQKDNIKVDCKCKLCGHTWQATPSNLLRKKGCAKCHHRKISKMQTKSTVQFIEELNSINPHIQILEEYQNSHIPIHCQCTIHQIYFTSMPTHLLQGKTGCPVCSGDKTRQKLMKTQEQYTQELLNANPNIEVIGKYIGARSPLQVQCKICNHVWSPIAGSLLSGNGCPHCSSSKGELLISKILEGHNIKYIPQMKFMNLQGVGGGLLSYDFYLPLYNTLIEFQGQFHDGTAYIEKQNDYFPIQQAHDVLKREYAKTHNINLLEIWYYDKNIEEILTSYLNNISNPVTTTVV